MEVDLGEEAVTQRLADAMAEIRFERLAPATVEATKWAYLDWLGSAVGGGKTLPGRLITEYAEAFRGSLQATRLTDGAMDSVPNAALVNGACSHVLELDDVHKGGIIHAAAPVMAAALACAQAQNANGETLITAIVAGYEACIRIAEAITPSHYRMWHTTGTCGTFGAAVAVGKVLGLDGNRMREALGSAGTQASGLWEFNADGAMSKHLHPGKAAMNGVIAAYLSRSGFTAAKAILEGRRGFFAATSEEVDVGRILTGLGDPAAAKILENSYKVHASCRHTHAAVDAALAIRDEVCSRGRKIARIAVKTYKVALDITDNPRPTSVYQAKFSLQFCVGLALARGAAGLTDFTEAALEDRDILDLLERVQPVVDPELDRMYPSKWPVRLEIELDDGTVVSAEQLYPKGDPENPFTAEEFRSKFRALVGHILGDDETERLIRAVARMDSASSVSQVIPIFRTGR